MGYNPKDYWEARLSKRCNLSGVGHIGFSEYYNEWLYKAKSRVLKNVLSLQRINTQDKTLCDIGCGTGFFINFYKQQGIKNILGVDITKVSIENLKRRYPEYFFIEEDITSPLLISKIKCKFDILNIFDVLYHIKDEESFRQAISNVSILAKNNGFIFITDSYGSRNTDVAEHVRYRSKNSYEEIFKQNSLKIMAIYPLYYLLNRPVLGMLVPRFLHKIGITLDNLFAPIYYYLDGALLSLKRNNLNLILARKIEL